MSQDTRPQTCPLCGASARERVLMQVFSVIVFIVELLHHNF
jgi:hypothetical protein